MRLGAQPIASEMKGQVSVVRVDTDQYPKLASRYNIKVSAASVQLTMSRNVCCVVSEEFICVHEVSSQKPGTWTRDGVKSKQRLGLLSTEACNFVMAGEWAFYNANNSQRLASLGWLGSGPS